MSSAGGLNAGNKYANLQAIQRLSQNELSKNVFEYRKSWHYDYRDSCYIFVGGIKRDLSEGDLVVVFSQFGDVYDVHLVRDKSTGKPKGFGFIAYEDARSAVLAVDNMNGYKLTGQLLTVDHVKEFRMPKSDAETTDNAASLQYETKEVHEQLYTPSGAEGDGPNKYLVLDSVSRLYLMRKEQMENTERFKTEEQKRVEKDDDLFEAGELAEMEENERESPPSRHRGKDRESERGRDRDRNKDRKKDRDNDRERGRDRERERYTERERHRPRYADLERGYSGDSHRLNKDTKKRRF